MKKTFRRVLGICVIVVVILSLFAPALAADPIDTNKKATLEIYLSLYNAPKGGGDLAIYKVADIDEDGVSTLAGAFAAGPDLNGLSATKLMDAASSLSGMLPGSPTAAGTTAADGRVTFSDLEVGAYLVVMTNQGANGFLMSPFIVFLPTQIEGVWHHSIKASPKLVTPIFPSPDESTEPPTEIPEESTPLDPWESEDIDIIDPSTPLDPFPPDIDILDPDVPLDSLPQTGVLQWPIPFMAVLGLLVFSAGWILNRNNKKAKDEK